LLDKEYGKSIASVGIGAFYLAFLC